MSSISAGTTTTTGYVVSSDTTGSLVLKTGASATTAVTVDTSQNVTFVGSQTLSAGTANGVTYLNGSKVLTSGSALTFDGTTLSSSIASAASGISLDSSTAGKANTVYRSAGTQKAIVGLAGAILGTSSTDLGLFAETGSAIKLFANGASTNSGTFNQYGLGIGAAVPSSGQGITFPAAQDASSNANTLDDYEEGTFNAGIAFGGNSVGVTYVTQAGAYVKTGRMVWCSLCIQTNSKGSSTGNLTITGLPFTASQVNGVFGVASEGIFNMNAGSGLSGTSSVSFYSEMGGSSTSVTCFFKTTAAQAYTVINNSNVENYFNYQLTICYQTST